LTQVNHFAFVSLPVESAQRLTCVKTRGLTACENGRMKAMVEMIAEPVTVRAAAKAKNNLAGVRLAREWKTMSAMVRIYCRDHHQERGRLARGFPGLFGTHRRDAHATGLCAECRQFLDYAEVRLEHCRFGGAKPTCANCPVHCYQRDRREQARVVMRYAGPRMIWEHPLMSLRHWLDGFRKAPPI